MPLPTSRNQTFDALSDIQPETMNDIQDSIIDIYHQSLEAFLPSTRFLRNGGTKATGYVYGFSEAYVASRLRTGTQIASISFRVRSPNGGDGLSFYIYEHGVNGAGAAVALYEGLETGNVDFTYTLAMPTNYMVPDGVQLEISVIAQTPAENCRLYSAMINIV